LKRITKPLMDTSHLDVVVRSALSRGHLSADTVDSYPSAMAYDLDAFEANLSACRAAFCMPPASSGTSFLHAVAIKNNPLAPLLEICRKAGHGAECASLSEVRYALALGFKPEQVVYDSPCKTRAEIAWALDNGILHNVDSWPELDRVDAYVKAHGGKVEHAVVGLRVNPLVGAGAVGALSVSTEASKFGIAVGDDHLPLLNALRARPWVSALHVHVGSASGKLDLLCTGVSKVLSIVKEINAETKQITTLDIGGGLWVNWASDEITPSYADYVSALQANVPELFTSDLRIVTEFGAATNTKFGWIASRVEYVKQCDIPTALIHVGADLLMRYCYCPGVFAKHRIKVLNSEGHWKQGKMVKQRISGPLCFSGDTLVDVELPELEEGDIVLILDTGGNTLGLFSRHNSRMAPQVLGYRGMSNVIDSGTETSLELEELKPQERIEEVYKFWGMTSSDKEPMSGGYKVTTTSSFEFGRQHEQ